MFGPFEKDLIVALVPEPAPGDANLDGKVGVADLGILGDHYGQTGAGWMQGDFNGDGRVGIADLGALGDNYGYGGAAARVPLPARRGQAGAAPACLPAHLR